MQGGLKRSRAALDQGVVPIVVTGKEAVEGIGKASASRERVEIGDVTIAAEPEAAARCIPGDREAPGNSLVAQAVAQGRVRAGEVKPGDPSLIPYPE